MFKYSVLKYVGAYAAAMNGGGLIVFTGGIGENDPAVREYISTKCAYLGVEFDSSVNGRIERKGYDSDKTLFKGGCRGCHNE